MQRFIIWTNYEKFYYKNKRQQKPTGLQLLESKNLFRVTRNFLELN